MWAEAARVTSSVKDWKRVDDSNEEGDIFGISWWPEHERSWGIAGARSSGGAQTLGSEENTHTASWPWRVGEWERERRGLQQKDVGEMEFFAERQFSVKAKSCRVRGFTVSRWGDWRCRLEALQGQEGVGNGWSVPSRKRMRVEVAVRRQ